MDTVRHYRRSVEAILTELAKIPYAHGDIELQTIFDRDNDHYLLMLVGRAGVRRVHGCLVHIDIRDGKLWIQRDGTEHGIARELLESGVPKDHIVLAFRSPEMRKITDFAIT
jgi:XisI protein